MCFRLIRNLQPGGVPRRHGCAVPQHRLRMQRGESGDLVLDPGCSSVAASYSLSRPGSGITKSKIQTQESIRSRRSWPSTHTPPMIYRYLCWGKRYIGIHGCPCLLVPQQGWSDTAAVPPRQAGHGGHGKAHYEVQILQISETTTVECNMPHPLLHSPPTDVRHGRAATSGT